MAILATPSYLRYRTRVIYPSPEKAKWPAEGVEEMMLSASARETYHTPGLGVRQVTNRQGLRLKTATLLYTSQHGAAATRLTQVNAVRRTQTFAKNLFHEHDNGSHLGNGAVLFMQLC